MSYRLKFLCIRATRAPQVTFRGASTDTLVDCRLLAVKAKIKEQQKHLQELDNHMYVATYAL